MSDDADRFRNRARECRRLAAQARDDHSRQTLSQMAEELEVQADALDAEDAHPGRPPVETAVQQLPGGTDGRANPAD